MNKHAYVETIKLLGKVCEAYGVNPGDTGLFDYNERAVLEQCIREWDFYKTPGAPLSARTGGKPSRKAERV